MCNDERETRQRRRNLLRHIDNHEKRLDLFLGFDLSFYSSIYGATYILN